MSTPTPKQHEEPSATNELITVDSNFMRRATAERESLLAENLRLREALRGMQKAADEIAAEYIQNKRAVDWAIVNEAYLACEAALAAGKGENS